MKSVLISIQPYYVFLIIAWLMGWEIPQHKTVEVRKNYPKDPAWNRVTYIYCSKNRKSFKRIPKQYQPLMKKLLGKVIGEFVCLQLEKFTVGSLRCDDIEQLSCLSYREMIDYFYKPEELDGKTVKEGYGWHISDLKIYDKPKEPSEFRHYVGCENSNRLCSMCKYSRRDCNGILDCNNMVITAPQSWCYVGSV